VSLYLKKKKKSKERAGGARCRQITPVILATQEAEIRRIAKRFLSQPRQIDHENLSRKYPLQKGLVEWFKVKVLRSSPSTTKKTT
jgi:hypothetical protein